MLRFIARRLVYLIPVWVGISLVAFVGDILANLLEPFLGIVRLVLVGARGAAVRSCGWRR